MHFFRRENTKFQFFQSIIFEPWLLSMTEVVEHLVNFWRMKSVELKVWWSNVQEGHSWMTSNILWPNISLVVGNTSKWKQNSIAYRLGKTATKIITEVSQYKNSKILSKKFKERKLDIIKQEPCRVRNCYIWNLDPQPPAA